MGEGNGRILLACTLLLLAGTCHEAVAADPANQLQSEKPSLESTPPPTAPVSSGSTGGAPAVAPPIGENGFTGGAPNSAPPQEYSAPQGYGAPQGYRAPGGYGAPQEGYNGAPAYGGPPPQGYGAQPQGYGAQTQVPPFSSGSYQGQPNYNTGIQYGEQYPPLQAPQQGYGQPPGGAYGGANYAQESYHVPPSYYQGAPQGGPGQLYSDRAIFAPAGLTLPVSLQTAISTQVAKNGDYIQGTINENVSLGGRGYIPAGTQVVGSVTDSVAGRRLSRSGELSIQFNSLRLPNGQQIPITAHLVGDLGKYKDKGTGGNDVYRGEGMMGKVGQTAIRGGLGAGLGAGLGTAVGAIAGGGHGAGMGAWSGAAIGGGIGVADMLLRKGRDVIIPTGTNIQVQLDQQVDLGGGPPPQYGGQPGYGQGQSGVF